MNWLIFGDDWGEHPSTTQHLVRHLPDTDRVVWINSVGMRSPRVSFSDARRVWGRLRARTDRGTRHDQPTAVGRPAEIIKPMVLPWHDRRAAVRVSRVALGQQIRRALARAEMARVVVLASNPVALHFLDDVPADRVAYLRLDDYPRLPGVDSDMVEPLDRGLAARADVVFFTAPGLCLDGVGERGHYLPQGVDVGHFSAVPLDPPGGRVLGFFGLLAEWVDYELVCAVADSAPDWTLEFLGPVRWHPDDFADRPNVRLRPGVSYDELPGAIGHWDAAWVPFECSPLTDGVNPLKLREYLAAGLPTLSTPLPAVRELSPEVTLAERAPEVLAWLSGVVAQDTVTLRSARRRAMHAHSWTQRAQDMRAAMASGTEVGH